MRAFTKFLQDACDSYEKSRLDGVDFPMLPRTNEIVEIEGMFHLVVAVVHSVDEGSTTLHLGQSCQSPVEAQMWSEDCGYPEDFIEDSTNEV